MLLVFYEYGSSSGNFQLSYSPRHIYLIPIPSISIRKNWQINSRGYIFGYKTLAVGGFATAAVNYGLPDLGLIGLKEIAEATKNISSAVDLPILADADGGYGNEVNMSRTIRELEISGAAAIFIEDQELANQQPRIY